MKIHSYPGIKFSAFFLGFYSALVQILILNEFMKMWGETMVGTVLFAWIGLSGVGSYIAIGLEKVASRLILPGFLLMAVIPVLSYWGIQAGAAFVHGNTIALCIIILSPVCLLNGILFSMLSQVTGKKASISSNYAYESAGTILAGASIVLWANMADTLMILCIAGVGFAITVFAGCYQLIKNKKQAMVIFAALITFFTAVSLSYPDISTRLSSRRVPYAIFSASSQQSFFHHATICTDLFFPLIIIPALLVFFFRKFTGIGRSIFIGGFACMSVEIIIMVPLKEFYNNSLLATGIITSIFMAGLVVGYGTKFPQAWNMNKTFKNLMLALAIQCTLLLILFLTRGEIMLYTHWFVAILISGGFIFSLLSGLLFTAGLQLQPGNIGKLVSSTYGTDMLGASSGALLISVMMSAGLTSIPILSSVTALLIITFILFKQLSK